MWVMINTASNQGGVSLHFEVYKYAFFPVDIWEKSGTENEKNQTI